MSSDDSERLRAEKPGAPRSNARGEGFFRAIGMLALIVGLPTFIYTAVYLEDRQSSVETRAATELAKVANGFASYANNIVHLHKFLVSLALPEGDNAQFDASDELTSIAAYIGHGAASPDREGSGRGARAEASTTALGVLLAEWAALKEVSLEAEPDFIAAVQQLRPDATETQIELVARTVDVRAHCTAERSRSCARASIALAEFALDGYDAATDDYRDVRPQHDALRAERDRVAKDLGEIREQIAAFEAEKARLGREGSRASVLFSARHREQATRYYDKMIANRKEAEADKEALIETFTKTESLYLERQREVERHRQLAESRYFTSLLESIRRNQGRALRKNVAFSAQHKELAPAYEQFRVHVQRRDASYFCPRDPSFTVDQSGRSRLIAELCPVREFEGRQARMSATLEFELGDLVGEVGSRLDLLLVVDANDDVLHQHSSSISSEIHRFALEREKEDPEQRQGAFAAVAEAISGIFGTSLDRDIYSWGGEDYYVFQQPVPIRLPNLRRATEAGSEGGPVDWRMVGLVHVDRFDSEASQLPLPVLVVATICLGFFVLSIAPLRLALLNPTHALSQGEIGTLVASIVILIAVATAALAHLTMARTVESRVDGRLEEFRASLETGFERELAENLDTLGRGARETRSESVLENRRAKFDFSDVQPSPDGCLSGETTKGEKLTFQNLIVIDDRGYVDRRTSNLCRPSVAIPSLRSREYVRRVLDGELWVSPTGQDRFFIQRIISWRDGAKETALSTPSPAKVDDGRMEVAVMFKGFRSFSDPVLGAGFGFAVVDASTGIVQFHSDDRLSLVENFYAETGGDRLIRGLVSERQRDFASGRYHGDPHRFAIGPLASTPWSLIVFVDQSYQHAVLFEAVTLTVFHLGIYALVCLVGLFAAGVFHSEVRWSWLWPDPERAQRTRRALGFLASALLLGALVGLLERPLFGPAFLPGPRAFFAVLLAGVFPFVLVVFVAWVLYESIEKDRRLGEIVSEVGAALARPIEERRPRPALVGGIAFALVAGYAARAALGALFDGRAWGGLLLLVALMAFLVSLLRLLTDGSTFALIVSHLPGAPWKRHGIVAWAERLAEKAERSETGDRVIRIWDRWMIHHTLALLLLLAVAGVPPALHLYSDALGAQHDAANRFSEQTVAREVRARATSEQELAKQLANYRPPSLDTWAMQHGTVAGDPVSVLGERIALFGAVGCGATTADGGSRGAGVRGHEESENELFNASYTAFLGRQMPPFDDATTALDPHLLVAGAPSAQPNLGSGYETRSAEDGGAPPLESSLSPAVCRNPPSLGETTREAAIFAVPLGLIAIAFHFFLQWIGGRTLGFSTPPSLGIEALPRRSILVGDAVDRLPYLYAVAERRRLRCTRAQASGWSDPPVLPKPWPDVLIVTMKTPAAEFPSVRRFAMENPKEGPSIVVVVESMSRQDFEDELSEAQLEGFEIAQPLGALRLLIRADLDLEHHLDDASERTEPEILSLSPEESEKHPISIRGQLVIRDLDSWFAHATDRNRLLVALEAAARSSCGARVVMRSRRAPGMLIESLEDEGERFRWNAALAPFRTLDYGDDLERGVPASTGFDQLERERRSWPELRVVHARVDAEIRGASASPDSVVGTGPWEAHAVAQRVAEAGHGFFREVWRGCNDDEKLMLHHLAEGRVLNDRDPGLVSGLMRRGLVKRAPDYQLASLGFRYFLTSPDLRREGRRLKQGEERGPSQWRRVRMPLGFAALVSLLLIIEGGGDAARSSITLLTGGAAGVPALLEMLGFGGSRQEASS